MKKNKIIKKLKKGDSISYNSNESFEKYNRLPYDRVYHSLNMDSNKVRVYTYNKKEYNPYFDPPIKIDYYKNGKIKSIKTITISGDWKYKKKERGHYILVGTKIDSKTYTWFYENGRIKKYMDFCEIDDYFPNGGNYIEFYKNGYKRCEGFFRYGYQQGNKYPITIEEPIYLNEWADLEQPPEISYEEGKDYFRNKLWVFYNKKGDIFHTIDYINSDIYRYHQLYGYNYHHSGKGSNVFSEQFIDWIDKGIDFPS
jgi:hypothetical protein